MNTKIIKAKTAPKTEVSAPKIKISIFKDLTKFLTAYFKNKEFFLFTDGLKSESFQNLLSEIEMAFIIKADNVLKINNLEIAFTNFINTYFDESDGDDDDNKENFNQFLIDTDFTDAYGGGGTEMGLNARFKLLPFTCGILEMGHYKIPQKLSAKTKIEVLEQFLQLFLIVKGLTFKKSYGQVQTTLVNKESYSLLKNLIVEYLPADTEIHFKNPNTGNELITYIWI